MPLKIVASTALALLTLSFAHADTTEKLDSSRHQQRPPVVDPPPSGTPIPKTPPTPPKSIEDPTKSQPKLIETGQPRIQMQSEPKTIATKPASPTIQTQAKPASAIEAQTKSISKSIEVSKESTQKQP